MIHENAPPELTGDLAAARWWPYGRLSKYPHMLTADVAVWESFVVSYPTAFSVVAYDVHLGHTWDVPQLTSSRDQAIAAGLTRLRSDVIAWDGQQIWVIEVKPNSTPGALGQALVYTVLQFDLDPQPVDLIPCVLAWYHHPALIHAAGEMGVTLLQAPPPPPALT